MQPQAQFAELQSPRLALTAEQSAVKIRQVVEQLQWQVQQDLLPEGRLHARVESPILGFTDNLYISIAPADSDGCCVILAQSRSRTGKADFGANAGHLYRLKSLLESD
ncbi:MAG: DUF1499 domain-containing protein [gamma proteobacterium symbiont of Bathyaustriella thionipta]|nr:DUF1499 domain-containing protein [gamma proteobacterium symbiont of Bathyaustriella thionipta]